MPINESFITAERSFCVVGLGYVGLPLAVALGKEATTVGFDIDAGRIQELRNGYDRTGEIQTSGLDEATLLSLSFNPQAIASANFYIITVPTPIDAAKRPDLAPLESACELIGPYLKVNDVVVFESTVYPGVTRNVCGPILERLSGLQIGTDFALGYSPERINPGDREHTLFNVTKLVSGNTPNATTVIAREYSRITSVPVYECESIEVAEAAKVIENVQRDVNIALVNEFALIFDRLGLDTHSVLEAAGTKWNFLKFSPGLVGGHCIGVDPYYLTHRAQEVGYHPEVILAGRRINDNMSRVVADRVILGMARKGIQVTGSSILILGFTFKENCPDTRNTKVFDVVSRLKGYGVQITICDPFVNQNDIPDDRDLNFIDLNSIHPEEFDSILLAVAHNDFDSILNDITAMDKRNTFIFDVKGTLPMSVADERL